jgi:putative ABC transport system permease protein
MTLGSRVRSWLRATFGRSRMESEMDVELRFHIAAYAEDLVRRGVPSPEAMRLARLEFGGVERVKEECREARGVTFLESLAQDLRYGLRTLYKTPTFAAVAVLTLALGVGANTAIFSIVNAVLLRSLPYRDPDRLVRIFFNNPGIGMRGVRFSVLEFDDLKTRSGVFEDVSAYVSGSVNLTGAQHPERLELLVTHPEYFSMLGVTPQLGRLFGPQDFALGFAPAS